MLFTLPEYLKESIALVTMCAQPGFLVGRGAAAAFRPGDMLHCSHAFSLALPSLPPLLPLSCLGTMLGRNNVGCEN